MSHRSRGETKPGRSLVRYDAVLDLASGCVRETYRALLPSTAEPPAGTEEPLGGPLARPELATRHCMNTPPHRPNTVFLMLLSPNGAFGEFQTGDFNQTRIHIVDTRTGANLHTLSDHVFGVARSELADDGSYVWQSSSNSQIRIAGARGDAVLRTKNEFLGLDLAGHALLFRRPPLKRQHKTGEMMPPKVGSLADYRCSLLEVADVYAAK